MNPNLRLITGCGAAILIAWFVFARIASSVPIARSDARASGTVVAHANDAVAPSSDATGAPSGYATPVACDDAALLRLEAAHPSGYTEVTVCGSVTSVRPEKTTRSGRHKYFYVQIDPAGDTIRIVTNIDETGEFNVNVGDTAIVHGRYYYDNATSQGIDWTHHNNANASWPYPGYVSINGGPLVQ